MSNKALKKIKQKPDFVLLGVIGFLLLWGIITVSTISFPFSIERFGTPWKYLSEHILKLCIGVILGIIFYKLSLEKLKKATPILFFSNLILLLAVFAPKIGVSAGGASRWINVFGFFKFQPSEFLKITFILYLAVWFAARKKIKKEKSFFQLFIPFCIMLIVVFGCLIVQPDLSTLTIIALAGVAMFFASPTALWQTATLMIAGAGAVFGLIKMAPYRANRLFTFLNPEADPMGIGYQLRQSLIALGSGKLAGVGQGLSFGLSRQKFGFVPHPMTDSIFAIIGEELGFIGSGMLICAFLFLAFWGFKIALQTQQTFYKLTFIGIIFWFCFQAFFNIGGIIGIMPLGGVPLPFFSYGGSHIITELTAVGILLNISKQNNLRKKQKI